VKTSLRAIAAAAVTAVALGGLTAAASEPASAGTVSRSGVTITANNHYLRQGCADVPVYYTVPAAEYWSVSATVTGAGSGFDAASSPDATSGTLGINLCSGIDLPGVYYVDATYENFTTGAKVNLSTSFQMLKAPARVTATPSPLKIKTGATLKVAGSTDYWVERAGWRNLPSSTVTLQWRRAHTTTWHNWTTFTTSGYGNYSRSLRYPFTYGVVVRARVAATDYSAVDYSPETWVARVS